MLLSTNQQVLCLTLSYLFYQSEMNATALHGAILTDAAQHQPWILASDQYKPKVPAPPI